MIENRKWKLGDDLSVEDNLLDEITFKELITTIRCNCQCITPENVQRELNRIMEIRIQDMKYLLENNIDEIIEKAIGGKNNE